MKNFYKKIELYKAPSTILFRSIELKLLKNQLRKFLKVRPVLDLGCADGIAAFSIFDNKIDYGLDNNTAFIKKAEKSGIYKKLILADARKIPLDKESLNLVFSNSTLEHIKDLDLVINEVLRILKKKGYFVFTAPSDNFKKYSLFSRLNINWLSKIYGQKREKKYNHYHCYSLQKWKRVLEKRGFRFIKGYYYFTKEIIEFWDFLLLVFFMLKINKKLAKLIYKNFFRKKIHKRFINARITDSKGAGICLVVQKI